MLIAPHSWAEGSMVVSTVHWWHLPKSSY